MPPPWADDEKMKLSGQKRIPAPEPGLYPILCSVAIALSSHASLVWHWRQRVLPFVRCTASVRCLVFGRRSLFGRRQYLRQGLLSLLAMRQGLAAGIHGAPGRSARKEPLGYRQKACFGRCPQSRESARAPYRGEEFSSRLHLRCDEYRSPRGKATGQGGRACTCCSSCGLVTLFDRNRDHSISLPFKDVRDVPHESFESHLVTGVARLQKKEVGVVLFICLSFTRSSALAAISHLSAGVSS